MRNCSVETGAANQIQRWLLMSSTLIAIKSTVHSAFHTDIFSVRVSVRENAEQKNTKHPTEHLIN